MPSAEFSYLVDEKETLMGGVYLDPNAFKAFFLKRGLDPTKKGGRP